MNGTNEINHMNEIDEANETGVLPVQTGTPLNEISCGNRPNVIGKINRDEV